MGRKQCSRCNDNCVDDEVVVCNTVFKYTLTQVDTNTHNLTVIACPTPTAVYDVGTIKTRENSCTGLVYYQAFVNTDPVQIIQDCSLCSIIARAIQAYFADLEPIDCGNYNSCGRNNFFGF